MSWNDLLELGQCIIQVVHVAWNREQTEPALLCMQWSGDFALQKGKLRNSIASWGFHSGGGGICLKMECCRREAGSTKENREAQSGENEEQQEDLMKTGHGGENQDV